jgi:hypothetical protein
MGAELLVEVNHSADWAGADLQPLEAKQFIWTH